MAVSTENFACRALASLPLRIDGAYNPAIPAAMAALTAGAFHTVITCLHHPFAGSSLAKRCR